MQSNKCKRAECHKSPAPEQVYCSKECAPYGYLSKYYRTAPYERPTPKKYLMHKDEITRLVSEGKSLAEIAQLLEIPYSTIVNYRQKLGIPLPKVVREPKPKTIEVKKARTGRIKNEIFLSRIKELASQGMTRSEIARRLNTSYPLVVYYEKNHGIKIALTKA